MSAKIYYYQNPFSREYVEISANPGETVGDALRDHCVKNNQLQLLIYRDRKHVEPSFVIQENDEIIVHNIPKSGVKNPGKFWTGIGLIGMGMLTFLIPLNPLGFIQGWSYVIGGLYLLGQSSGTGISASGTAAKSQSDTVYSLRGGNNVTAKYSKVPIILGKNLVVPPYAGSGFSWVTGTYGVDQYVTLLFCLGYGQLSVKNLKFGDQLIATNAADVRDGYIDTSTGVFGDAVVAEIAQDSVSGTPTVLYGSPVNEEYVGAELLPNNTDGIIRATGATGTRIAVDVSCPRGLGRYSQKGEIESITIRMYLKYRLAGSGGAWNTLYSNADDEKHWDLTGSTNTHARFTTGWVALPTLEEYEVMLVMDAAGTVTSSAYMDQVIFDSVKTINDPIGPINPADAKKITQIAIKVKASQAISGTIAQFSCECDALMPVWDTVGSGPDHWALGLDTAQNPACAFLHVLTGPMNPRPATDEQIDWVAVETWADWCYTNGYKCNLVIANGMAIEDALQLICATGRAQLGKLDGKYRPIHDTTQTTPIQLITPRNSWGFTFQKSFTELAHALAVTFINEAKGWEVDEAMVFWDGYTASNATLIQKMEMPGVTNWTQVWRLGRYLMASQRLRPEIFTVMMDVEALRATRWDLVRVNYDTVGWGYTPGRIVSVTTVAGEVTALTVDENCPMVTGTSYGVRVRTDTGVQYYSGVTTVNGDNSTLTLTTPFTGADLPKSGDLYTFGVANLDSVECIILGIEPENDLVCKLTLCEYNAAIYTADSGAVPTFTSKITRVPFFPAPIVVEKITDPLPTIRPASLQYVAEKEDITVPYDGLLAVENNTGDTYVYDGDAETWIIQPLEATAIAAVQADADAANALLSDIASDSKFTPVEKQEARLIWDAIAAEKAGYDSQATAFGITTEKTTYDNAFQALATYLNNGTTWSSGVPTWIADANLGTTTNIAGSTFRSTWKAYYDARTALVNKFSSLAKTSADAANTLLADIASDGKLTPVEKQESRLIWDAIAAEKSVYDSQATSFGISTEKTTYDNAFQALATYLNNGTTWSSGVPSWISDANLSTTTTIVGATFRTNWKTYYDARTALANKFSSVAKVNADAAIAAAHEASIELALTTNALTRSRSGVLTPATLTASAKYGDTNAAYSGRFEIANSTDGLTFDIDNGIPNDPAGTTYLSPALWASGVSGWIGNLGTIAIVSGKLRLTKTTTSANYASVYKTYAFGSGKTYKVKITALQNMTLVQIRGEIDGVGGSVIQSLGAMTAGQTIISNAVASGDVTNLYPIGFVANNATVGDLFDISWVYVGTGASLWYQSSANESSKVYTPPVTSLGNYVNMIRVRLYKADGFTITLRERLAGITADTSSAAIYWGPLTTAPTTGIAANDYYFDNNNVAGGGGKIRYYTGSTWAEATSAWGLWYIAKSEAMDDMVAWTNIYGADLIAAVNAMITNLTAQTAFISELFANDIKASGSIRIGDRYNADGTVADATVDGIWMGNTGVQKVSGLIIEGASAKWLWPELIGAELAIANVGYPALASMGLKKVAFIDTTNCDLRMYEWSGSAWSMIGSELNISGIADTVHLAAMDSSHVAFIDEGNDNLRMYEWSGSAWSMIGSGLAITNSGGAIAALDTTHLALKGAGSDSLRVYEWSGSAWSMIGSAYSMTGNSPSIATIDSTHIAFITGTSADLMMMEWSGSAWSVLGDALHLPGIDAPAMTALNSTDIVLDDAALDVLRIYRWNGASWTEVSSLQKTTISGKFVAMSAMNGTDIAFIDSTNDALRYYRFVYTLSMPISSVLTG